MTPALEPPRRPPPRSSRASADRILEHAAQAVRLVWTTSPRLATWLLALSAAGGVLPALIAWIGKGIVDGVVAALETGGEGARLHALGWVALELAAVATMAAVQRGLGVARGLLRAELGHRVNVLILEKAVTLELRHFEDSELYDRMTRARREASSRPLSLVMRTFGLLQDGISLASYAVLLADLSAWAVVLLVVAALPVFVAETRFSGEAFRLFRWRTPETRVSAYLESVLAREDHVKEVQAYGLGPLLLGRYRGIFERLYAEDRRLAIRRGAWGLGLGLLSTLAFYGAYAWIVLQALAGSISLGEMTMYVLVFKQGQSAVASALGGLGGLYEDHLYLSTLFEVLDEPVAPAAGSAVRGATPLDGIRFEGVAFAYPGSERPAVADIDFHLAPGTKLALVGENGSGKTTLVKLLARLYEPSEGRILLDGTDLREWSVDALRERMAIVFQDFVRYQLMLGENIGAGDVTALDDEERWRRAAERGTAAPFVATLPEGYRTQLGRWFWNGRELSLGQWQKVALSRAFMRERADILVLDEPTASMDAAAEVEVFERLGTLAPHQMAILISHRFSTVRMADQILVLDAGHVVEHGSHEELVAAGGRYARLFGLQAAGYR